LMYALMMFGSVLGSSLGEADLRLDSCPDTSLFFVNALVTLAMEVLHVALMVLAFDAIRRDSVTVRRLGRYLFVFVFHLLASLSTLFNVDASIGGCFVGVPLVYVVVVLASLYTASVVRRPDYKIRGSFQTLRNNGIDGR